MSQASRFPPTVLFTLRLWREDLGGGHTEWRGEIKNITSGEVRHFRDWLVLAELLPKMLSDAEDQPSSRIW